MSNPFTRFLLQGRPRDSLHQFVENWDELETLCIRTFKSRAFSPSDAKTWRSLQHNLSKQYNKFEQGLRPFWQATKIEGLPIENDPFAWILSVRELDQVVGNWALMQRLPAAREALNQFILSATA